jgi:hypothetical protein
MDVKTTFLHVDLEAKIYMKQPEGFDVKGKKELVCTLKNFIYDLNKSPRSWYQKICYLYVGTWLHKEKSRSLCVFQINRWSSYLFSLICG